MLALFMLLANVALGEQQEQLECPGAPDVVACRDSIIKKSRATTRARDSLAESLAALLGAMIGAEPQSVNAAPETKKFGPIPVDGAFLGTYAIEPLGTLKLRFTEVPIFRVHFRRSAMVGSTAEAFAKSGKAYFLRVRVDSLTGGSVQLDSPHVVQIYPSKAEEAVISGKLIFDRIDKAKGQSLTVHLDISNPVPIPRTVAAIDSMDWKTPAMTIRVDHQIEPIAQGSRWREVFATLDLVGKGVAGVVTVMAVLFGVKTLPEIVRGIGSSPGKRPDTAS